MSVRLIINDEGDYNKLPDDYDAGDLYFTLEQARRMVVEEIINCNLISVQIPKFMRPEGETNWFDATTEEVLERLR